MIDCLARTALWDAGLDYLHGTGHGVGAFLNVHEGQFMSYSVLRISKQPAHLHSLARTFAAHIKYGSR